MYVISNSFDFIHRFQGAGVSFGGGLPPPPDEPPPPLPEGEAAVEKKKKKKKHREERGDGEGEDGERRHRKKKKKHREEGEDGERRKHRHRKRFVSCQFIRMRKKIRLLLYFSLVYCICDIFLNILICTKIENSVCLTSLADPHL